jgi:hypothetical protein
VPVFGYVDPGVVHPDHHEPFRVGVRERAQQDRVDDAEDGRVRPDPHRQSQHYHYRESGLLQKHPRAVTKVLHERFHKISPLPILMNRDSGPGSIRKSYAKR